MGKMPSVGSVVQIPLREGEFALGLVSHSGTKQFLIRVNLLERYTGDCPDLPEFDKKWETFFMSKIPFTVGNWKIIAEELEIPEKLKEIPYWVFPNSTNLETKTVYSFDPKSLGNVLVGSVQGVKTEEIIAAGWLYIENYLDKKIPTRDVG